MRTLRAGDRQVGRHAPLASVVAFLVTMAAVLVLSNTTTLFDPGGTRASGSVTLGSARPTGIASQSQVQGPLRIVVPGLVSQGRFLEAVVSTGSMFQGGTTLVTVPGGVQGTAYLFGRAYPLEPSTDGSRIEGFVGVGVLDPPGETMLRVETADLTGAPTVIERPVTIVRTEWTVDYIVLPPPPPPDPDAPPPPPPPPDETPLLPQIYAGLTPRQWEEGWAAPLAGELRVTGLFGEQRSFNGGPVQGHHGGTDFGAPAGTPIFATNSGTVVLSGLYRIRGNLVIVDHGAGIFSLYGHMIERLVNEGDVVTRGQVLGLVGSTGLSTGAHLHWELAVSGILVDGLRWLDGSQGF